MRLRFKALRARLADRSGLTLTEVLLAMGLFLVGSVSVIGLFVTGSVLHADACNRRTASFIANDLLAEVQGRRFREVMEHMEELRKTVTPEEVEETIRILSNGDDTGR